MSSSEEKLEALASFTSSLLASAAANENEIENENTDQSKVDEKPTEEAVTEMETGDNDVQLNGKDQVEDDEDTRHQLEEHVDLGEEILDANDEPEIAPNSDPIDAESMPMVVDLNDTTRSNSGSRPATPISGGSRPASPASPRDIEIEYKDEDDKNWESRPSSRSASPQPQKVATSTVLFGRKSLKLKIKKLNIPKKSMIGTTRVDLKSLKQARPSLFRFEKSSRVKSSSVDKVKKERAKKETEKVKKEKVRRLSKNGDGSKDKKPSSKSKPKKETIKPELSAKTIDTDSSDSDTEDKKPPPIRKEKSPRPIKKVEKQPKLPLPASTALSGSDSDSDSSLKALKMKIMKASTPRNPLDGNTMTALVTLAATSKPTSTSTDRKPKSKEKKKTSEKVKTKERTSSTTSTSKTKEPSTTNKPKEAPKRAMLHMPPILKPFQIVVNRLTVEEIEKYEQGLVKFEPLVDKVAEKRRSRSKSSRHSSLSSRSSQSSSPIRKLSPGSRSSSSSVSPPRRRSRSRSSGPRKEKSQAISSGDEDSDAEKPQKKTDTSKKLVANPLFALLNKPVVGGSKDIADKSSKDADKLLKVAEKAPKSKDAEKASKSDTEKERAAKSDTEKERAAKSDTEKERAAKSDTEKERAAKSDGEKEKVTKPKAESDVKQVLVEKLMTMLKPEDETPVSANKENVDIEKKESDPSATKNVDEKPTDSESKSKPEAAITSKQETIEAPKSEEGNKVKKESDAMLEEKDKTKEVKKEEPKESFERGLLEYNSGLRQFCDAVKIEIGAGTLDFLAPISYGGNSKSAKIDLIKFEEMIMSAVKSLERTGQGLSGPVSSKPNLSKIPPVGDKFKLKLGSKICQIKLKDVSMSSKYRKSFLKAKDNLSEGRRMKISKRKERLLSGLKNLKLKSKDSKNWKRSHASDDESDPDRKHKKNRKHDDSSFTGFKIPKKGEKPSREREEREEKSSNDKNKTQIRTDGYNHSYSKRPNQPNKPFHAKKSFEQDLSGAKPSNFNVLDLVSGMKKDDRKKEEFGDIRARDRLKEQSTLKKLNPSAIQNKPTKPLPSEHDEELDRILGMRILDKKGQIMSTITTWNEGRSTWFKCWICSVSIENKPNLMTHMSSYRHLGNKRMYTPVTKDDKKQQQQRQQSRDREPESNEWPPPKSRHSRPEPFGINGLPQPHKRIRPDQLRQKERTEEPWRFSPSEVESDRYERRVRTPPPDDYNDNDGGGGYNDDIADYDDSPPPPPPPSFPLPFSFPKPVPIMLPKPVPTTNRSESFGGTSVLNPAVFGSENSSQFSSSRRDFNSDSSRSRVRFEASPERSMTPPMPAPARSRSPSLSLFVPSRPRSPPPSRPRSPPMQSRPRSPNSFMRPGTESPNSFMRPGTGPGSSSYNNERQFSSRDGSPKAYSRSNSPQTMGQNSSPPRPVPPPQPVPPPTSLETKQKLSVAELGRLPPPMSMRDRVARLRKGPETPPSPMRDNDNDTDSGSAIAGNDDDNIGESPPTSQAQTPVWEPTPEERGVIWPGKEKTTFDETFNIDTTKSFLDSGKPTDKIATVGTGKPKPSSKTSEEASSSTSAAATAGIKLKPLSNLVTPSTEKNSESAPAPAGLSSFLDKVISALKKTGGSTGPAPKPKTNSMQLPSMNTEDDDTPPMRPFDRSAPRPLSKKQPQGSASAGVSPPRAGEASAFETDNLWDDSDVRDILAGLDQTLSEEERLVRAKEKLTVLLTRKAEERLAKQQLLQQQQQRAARSLTSHDISDFMSQYCGEQVIIPQEPNAPPLPPLPPPAEPTLSSALAKLRAKKAARAGGLAQPLLPPPQGPPQPLMMALDKLRKIHEPRPIINPMFAGPPVVPPPAYPGSGRMSPQNKRPAPDMDFDSYKRFKLQDEDRYQGPSRDRRDADPYSRQGPYPPSERHHPDDRFQPADDRYMQDDRYQPSNPRRDIPSLFEVTAPVSNRFARQPEPPPQQPDGDLIESKYIQSLSKIWNAVCETEQLWARKMEKHDKMEESKRMEAQSQTQDLGAQFQDPRLNQRFVNSTGQPVPLFSCTEERGTLSFKCELCQVSVFGKRNLDSHMEGKKHIAKMETVTTADPIPSSIPKPYVPSEPLVKEFLDNFREAPLIGLEYIIEILRPRQDPIYKCMICKQSFDLAGLIADLVSVNHRMGYLKLFFPVAYSKFSKVPNIRVWASETFDFLEGVILRIENRKGRLCPTIVGSEDVYDRDAEEIVRIIDNGPHIGQTPELDFASLPDPFAPHGSYR